MFEIKPIECSSDVRIAGLDETDAESYQFRTITGGVGFRIEGEKEKIALRKLPK